MKVETKAQVLSAESKPYSIDGNSGTSHKIRLNIGGEIFVCKSTAEQIAEFTPFVGKEVDVVIEIVSRKENMSLRISNFSA